MSVGMLEEFKDIFTGITKKEIYPTSYLVSEITGIPIASNKAIVGSNINTHYSGIHQMEF
jgi:isopropylmalate/homocitrate/citramalate synthase